MYFNYMYGKYRGINIFIMQQISGGVSNNSYFLQNNSNVV